MMQTDAPHEVIIDEENTSNQQHQVPSTSDSTPGPKKPTLTLLGPDESREQYLKIGVPLYKAAIRCDWKAAEDIFKQNPDLQLIRCSITENGETALHVAASAKVPKKVEVFVQNLVDLMEVKDLELQNDSHNTALYLAAATGNIKTVEIMLKKNERLLTIAGGGSKDKVPELMPIYNAALYGNHEMVKYMYEKSSDLSDANGWIPKTRGWLLEKCVENNMFDIALKIVKKHEDLAINGSILGILAGKPEAFSVKRYNFMWRFIIWVFAFIGVPLGAPENEGKALPLLKHIWGAIAKKPRKGAPENEGKALPLLQHIWGAIAKKTRKEIDTLLRGKPDVIKDKKSESGWAVQAIQLQNLISAHVSKMKNETHKIMGGPQDSVNQETIPASDQAQKLEKLISEHLVSMHRECETIVKGPIDSIKQDNKTVSGKGDQALKLQKLIYGHISELHEETRKILNNIRKEDQARPFQKLILERTEKMQKETNYILHASPKVYSSQVVFIAAEMGNTNFLIELIRKYPDLIWKVNDDKQSIFHIAVKYRHEGIYNLLYEIGAMKDMITPLRDTNDNNMLHLVGKSAKKKQLEDVSGVALQMQRELLWFQEVKNMIPVSYRERKNQDDLTPHELFTKDHKELVIQGEKWMKGTTSQCMVVAALIATIVFAAAFTVPGGYHQADGIPIFHSQATFMVFVVADAISLFASSASILMFLSILTSRYAERDFLESLPKKLMLGLVTLFLSITTMTVAFCISFFVLYHKGLLWMPILIAVFGLMPVLLYVWLQHSLFLDVIRSTFRSRYLFKPKKQVLYYENPKV